MTTATVTSESTEDRRTRAKEVWETTTASSVSVNVYDHRNNIAARVVGGQPGMRVLLTTAEREELNEDLSGEHSIFHDGTLRPVRNVPAEIVERFETITKRHGGLSRAELIELFGKSGNAFVSKVRGFDEATLRHMLEVAVDPSSGVDATASQSQAIEAALEKFRVTRLRETTADSELRRDPRMPVG